MKKNRFQGIQRRFSPRLQAKAQRDAPTPAPAPENSANQIAKSVPTRLSSSKKLKLRENVNTTLELRRSRVELKYPWESNSSSLNSSSSLSYSLAHLHAIGNFLEAEANPLTAPACAQGGGKESDQGAVAVKTSCRQEAVEEASLTLDAGKKMPRVEYSSLGLSEMANLFSDDASSLDELQSASNDPALVSVCGYRVKPTTAPTLRTMIEKHGDIAVNCVAKRVETRSYFLETICGVVQTLQTTKFVDVTEVEVKEMLDVVEDIGVNGKIDVGWLQKRLQEILEAKELLNQYPKVKEQKQRNARIIEDAKKEIERLEAQIQVLKEMVSSEKAKMEAAKAANKDVTERVSSIRDRVNRYIEESLLHDLH